MAESQPDEDQFEPPDEGTGPGSPETEDAKLHGNTARDGAPESTAPHDEGAGSGQPDDHVGAAPQPTAVAAPPPHALPAGSRVTTSTVTETYTDPESGATTTRTTTHTEPLPWSPPLSGHPRPVG